MYIATDYENGEREFPILVGREMYNFWDHWRVFPTVNFRVLEIVEVARKIGPDIR